MPDTLATIRARTPKLKGESEFAYQQRLGLRLKQEQQKTSLPNPFDATSPRRDHEPGWNYNTRQALGPMASAAGQGLVDRAGAEVASIWDRVKGAAAVVPSMEDVAIAGTQLVNGLFETGAEAKQRVAQRAGGRQVPPPTQRAEPGSGGNPFAGLNSYQDPRWGSYEAVAEKKYGLPPGTLAAIRTRGERSNNDQVSKDGARTVYQIIPKTRAGILQNYKFDPYASPANAALGAAAVLAEGLKRTGSIQGAVQQYHGGLDPKQYGPQNAAYMDRMFGAGAAGGGGPGNPLGLVNPFDPSYGNAALAEIDKATALASQPFTMTQDMPEAPAVPEPILAPKTDFTAINEATERLRPQMDDEKKQLRMRRSAYFAGIGQALMSIPEGAGLGKVLGMMGGGALMGAAKGDAEVQARLDAYEEKMARFNVLLLNNQKEQAATARQEAMHEAQTLNAYGLKKWEVAYDQWAKLNQTTVQGDAVITSRFDPKTNKLVTKRIPIASAVQAAGAMQRAQVFQQMGGQMNSANAQVAGVTNGLIAAQAAQAFTQKAEGAEDALVAVPAFVATEAYAALPSVLGEENWAEFAKEAQTVLAQQNISPGSTEYNEMMKQYIVTKVTQLAAINPTFRKNLMGLGGVAQQNRAVRADRQRTTRTGPKGTTTTTREEY